MGRFFQSDFFYNLVPLLVVAALIFVVVRARRQPLWAEAYRRIGRNKIALTALAVIGLYGLVALADSIGWTDRQTQTRLTLIDRVFGREKEKTYSAPRARMTTGEPIPTPLKAPGKHLLGTDGVGDDVLYRTLKGCRTAFIIGGLTSLIATPLALCLGLLAG